MLPGVTIEDVRAAAGEFVPGAPDASGLLGDAVLGVDHGPHDHFVTAMPLDAGNYAVFLTTNDATLASTPPASGFEVRQLTVAAGTAGVAPTPSMTFERLTMDALIGPVNAPRGAATIRVDNTVAGGPFQLALIELRADTTRGAYEAWEHAITDGGRRDWSTAPIATLRAFYVGAAQQTVTIDLDGGDLIVDAPSSFDRARLASVIAVSVE
jgi:hypothetical protein